MATKATEWKSSAKQGTREVELPSGNTALLRPIAPEAFLESGMIPEPLMAVIQRSINSKKGMRPQDLSALASDPKQLAMALEMFDRSLVYCVVEPDVEMPPRCTQEGCNEMYTGGEGVHVDRKHAKHHKYTEPARDPDVLYADQVDLTDKQFIFQWAVGGTSDLREFRKQLSATLESVQAGQSLRMPPEQPPVDQ